MKSSAVAARYGGDADRRRAAHLQAANGAVDRLERCLRFVDRAFRQLRLIEQL
jgi:hypothetical protein